MVPVVIINLVEAIQINECDAERPALPFGQRELFCKDLVEVGAVVKPREAVASVCLFELASP